MTDANTSSPALPDAILTPPASPKFRLENWSEPQSKAEPGCDRTRGRSRGAPGACARDRERESDGVLGRARQLRLPTMAAQGGLQLRVSSRRVEKRQDEREAERYRALRFAELHPDARRERERERLVEPTDRPIDHRLLGLLTSFVLLCILQRGRGQDEVIISSFSVPSAGFQGSSSGGRLLGVPRCCVEGENHPWLRNCDTAVWFRAVCNRLGVL